MGPLPGRVLALLAWLPLVNSLVVDPPAEAQFGGAAYGYEEGQGQMMVESSHISHPPLSSSNWEADLVKDDVADREQWDDRRGSDRGRERRQDLKDEAKQSLKEAVIAKEKYEDSQEEELKLRDKMLQARSLAKKQQDIVAALKDKQNWQKESLKWLKEDIKFGKGQIKKFQKAIKAVEEKIGEKEQRIDTMKKGMSPEKKAAFTSQEIQEMASRLRHLQKAFIKRRAALKATRKKFKKLRKQELQAEKKLHKEEKKQAQAETGVQSEVLSSIWSRLGWS